MPITSKNVFGEMKSANCPDHVLEKIFEIDKISTLHDPPPRIGLPGWSKFCDFIPGDAFNCAFSNHLTAPRQNKGLHSGILMA